MTLSKIAEVYCIDNSAFEKYVLDSGMPYTRAEPTMLFPDGEMAIPDAYVNDYVEAFWDYNEQQWEDRKEELAEEEDKRKALSQMLISSGFSFDGYKIVKYSGYISGDDAARVESTWILASDQRITDKITGLLVGLRRRALQELKEAAYDLGCNAVVGVDFDYLTLEPKKLAITGGGVETVFIAVTANGNAVVIEKEDD